VHAKQLDGQREHAEDEKDDMSQRILVPKRERSLLTVVSIRHLDHAPRIAAFGADVPGYMYERSLRRALSASPAHTSGKLRVGKRTPEGKWTVTVKG